MLQKKKKYIIKQQNTMWNWIKWFQVWLPNRLISAGQEPVLSHTEKLCISSYYKQFSTNVKIKTIKLIPVLFAFWF